MNTIAASLFCAFAAVLGTDAYVTASYEAQALDRVVAAKVEAYSAGREDAIKDMMGAQGPTSAPAAELCTAWWFGTNNKIEAMQRACKNINAPQKVKSVKTLG